MISTYGASCHLSFNRRYLELGEEGGGAAEVVMSMSREGRPLMQGPPFPILESGSDVVCVRRGVVWAW